jgi:hypothetical protein
MDTDAEVAGVVAADGLEMGRFETFPHGRDQDGFMDPVLAGRLDIGETME